MPRLILAVLAAFIFVFASDFLIHAVWMSGDYEATKQLWRSEAEMGQLFPWMLTAQFLCALAFTVIWAMGFGGRSVGTGAMVGLFFGIGLQAWAIIFYVVAPMPGSIAVKWFLAGVLQAIVLGIVVAAVYKPAAARG